MSLARCMFGLQRNQTFGVGSRVQITRGLAGLGCTTVMDNRTSRSLKVGWVGLGKMGFHMAGHVTRKVLAENGEIRVYNRSVDKAQAHARQFGSMPVTSLQELSGCDVVFSCLATTAQVDEVSAQVSNAGVWVDCTPGDSQSTLQLGARLAARGMQLVDSPVKGGPAAATTGTLTAMMRGDAGVLSEVESLVGSFASDIHRCSALGNGMTVMTVQGILYDTACKTAAFTEAAEDFLAMQVRGVVPSEALVRVAQASTAAAPWLHVR